MIWTEETKAAVRRLIANGATHAEAARALGMTRDVISSAVRRYGLKPGAEPAKDDRARADRIGDRWTEERLTERWADRRRAA
jgi:transposase-like protein